MKCDICGNETNRGILSSYAGTVCEDCKPEARRIRDEAVDEARTYDFGNIPDAMEVGDFEKFVFAYCVLLLDDEKTRETLREVNPLLGIPEELASFWKERLLEKTIEIIMKAGADNPIAMKEATGLARWFSGGEYRFRDPVDRSFVLTAAVELGMIEPDGDDE